MEYLIKQTTVKVQLIQIKQMQIQMALEMFVILISMEMGLQIRQTIALRR